MLDGEFMTLEQSSVLPPPYIGRITFTQDRPAGPNEFWCWLQDSRDLNVQVGSLLCVDGEGELILVVVSDLEYTSAARDVSTEFYGSGYGDPRVQPPTRPTIIRCAKLRTLLKIPSLSTPPEGRWGVRHVNANDLAFLAERVPPNRRILGGFLKIGLNEDSVESWHPVYLHADFLLGPEGAHANISGVTGLATKTSYALFLAYSILTWAKRNQERVAVILFNVKRRDFLRLHKLPRSEEEAKNWAEQWAKERLGNLQVASRVITLWKSAQKDGVDPISDPPKVKYFTFQGDPDVNFMENPTYIRYGLANLERGEIIAALYRPDEEPGEQQINLINAYLEAYPNVSFDRMLNDLRLLAQMSGRSARQPFAQAPQIGLWDERTVNAVLRRLIGFRSRAVNIIEYTQPRGNPLTFQSLVEGLNVIQLNRLHDTEKRLLVNAVLREVSRGLELPENQRQLDRVAVIVDELNKYAPKRWSPIKDQIIDVVARGRDLKLSLIGAQQFASDLDNEVLGNSTTRVVGRSDPSEVNKTDVYAQLGDFRDIAPYLEKGEMILYHPVHPAPFIVWFPTPLHEIGLAAEVRAV